jgi:hypothetical protein
MLFTKVDLGDVLLNVRCTMYELSMLTSIVPRQSHLFVLRFTNSPGNRQSYLVNRTFLFYDVRILPAIVNRTLSIVPFCSTIYEFSRQSSIVPRQSYLFVLRFTNSPGNRQSYLVNRTSSIVNRTFLFYIFQILK